MIISANKILQLNKKHKLIENIADRELNPEGVGIDIRVGEVYQLQGTSFLGVKERRTPEVEKIADIKYGDKILLNPGDFVLVKTIEKVKVPGKKVVIKEGQDPVF